MCLGLGAFLHILKPFKISDGAWNSTSKAATNNDSGKQDLMLNLQDQMRLFQCKISYKFVNLFKFPIAWVSVPVRPLL